MFSRETKAKSKSAVIEEIICERYNSYYRMAYSYVHNDDDASDIVQEGAYKAMKNCDSLKQTEHAATWIYRIMMNEVYRVLQSRKHLSTDDEDFIEPPTYDQYADIDLQRALDALAHKDKAVVQLKYFEDMKLEEIAKILNENVSTVKSRLYRGLKKLQLVMESED